MRFRAIAAIAAGLALGGSLPARAQISVSNVLEAQAGSVPFASYFGIPTNSANVYNQFNVVGSFGSARGGLRLESLDNTQQVDIYRTVTQRWAEWEASRVRVRVGDFTSILGHGLVQRAFELPGVVLDDPGTERRRAFSNELDGVHVQAGAGPFEATLLAGTPGTGSVFGGQAAVGPIRAARTGATYLRTTNGDGSMQMETGSGFLELDPLAALGLTAAALPLYFEYAQHGQTLGDWWEFGTGNPRPHALYASSNLLWGPLALTAEWKDYRDFRLGLNDPPSLVREHGFALPNRSTHVLNATSEYGTQLEGSWSFSEWGSVTANHTRAAGTPGIEHLRFEENYAELHLAAPRWPWIEATVFGDRGFDRFVRIDSRAIWGAASTVRAFGPWSLALDVQRLDAERANLFGPREGFTDWYASAEVARAAWGSASLVWQRSTDPIEEDPEKFDDRIDPRTFFAVVLAAELGDAHHVQLFAGERRGGPACTAGTCYEVQPFKGAELRVVSRFP